MNFKKAFNVSNVAKVITLSTAFTFGVHSKAQSENKPQLTQNFQQSLILTYVSNNLNGTPTTNPQFILGNNAYLNKAFGARVDVRNGNESVLNLGVEKSNENNAAIGYFNVPIKKPFKPVNLTQQTTRFYFGAEVGGYGMDRPDMPTQWGGMGSLNMGLTVFFPSYKHKFDAGLDVGVRLTGMQGVSSDGLAPAMGSANLYIGMALSPKYW